MYTLMIETDFKAQHQLRYADHQEPLHEHNWHVIVSVCSEQLDSDGLAMDFEELKTLLETIVSEFRGKQLETLGIFEYQNASAEIVASTIFDLMKSHLPDTVRLDSVEVTEAPGCRARYSK